MATSTSTSTITVNLDSKQLEKSLQRVEKSFDRLNKRLVQNQKTTKKTNSGAKNLSDQGLANMQAGLVQLSTYLMNVNQTLDNVFDKMKTKFIQAQSAMVRLRITMGIAGEENTTDSSMLTRIESYKKFETEINKYAETTEYTKKQVADAFSSLIQNGRTAQEAMNQLLPTLQLTTASMGSLGLTEAIQLADLQMTTLGGNVKDTEKNFGMLLRMTQKTKVQFKDLEGVMSSLKGAHSRFGTTRDADGILSKPAEMMALVGIVRRMGLGAKESGQKVEQFTRSIASMYNTARKGELYAHKTSGTQKPRFSLKRQELLNFFGVAREKGGKKRLNELAKEYDLVGAGLNRIQDEFLKRQLMKRTEGGKFVELGATELIEKLRTSYKRLIEERGSGEAKAVAQQAFGQEAGAFVLNAVVEFEEGNKTSLRKFVKGIIKDQDELRKAHEEALKSLENKLKVLTSAEDALSETLMKEDVMANGLVETYTAMLSTVTAVLRKNKSLTTTIGALGRTMQVATDIGFKLGFALTASATFSIALSHSAKVAGGAMTGLSGILKSFYAVFLAPTVRVLLLMSGGLFVVGLGVMALMKHFSTAETIGEGFSQFLGDLKTKAMDASYALKLLFAGGEDFEGQTSTEIVKGYQKLVDDYSDLKGRDLTSTFTKKDQETGLTALTVEMGKYEKIIGKVGTKRIADPEFIGHSEKLLKIVDRLKSIFNGLKIVVDGALGPMGKTMGLILDGLYKVFMLLTLPIRIVLDLLGYFGASADENSKILTTFGVVLGWVLGIFTGFKVVSLIIFMMTKMASTITGTFTRIASAEARLKITTESVTTGIYRQASGWDKLRLKLLSIKGSNEALHNAIVRVDQDLRKSQTTLGLWGRAVDRVKMKQAGFTAGLTKMGRGAKGLGRTLMGVEMGLLAIGGIMSYNEMGESGWGKTIFDMVMGLSLLLPLLTMVAPLLWSGAVAMWGFLTPMMVLAVKIILIIGLIAGLVAGLAWLGGWWDDDKELKVQSQIKLGNGGGTPSTLGSNESAIASNRTYHDRSRNTINIHAPVTDEKLDNALQRRKFNLGGSHFFGPDPNTRMDG